jgi:4-hydroxy-3-methylbut-2-enyl diphosphate reductase
MSPVLATPLRVEWAALRPAARFFRLVRTGMGRAAVLAPTSEPVLIAGVAGGLAPEVRPGDLVVADSVTDGTHRIELPSGEALAGLLRSLGLTVHCGSIRTEDRVVTGARRARLADTGALAVDMESARLAATVTGPVAVVRSIVDTGEHALWAPGTVVRGIRALRALRAAIPGFQEWAASVASREVS